MKKVFYILKREYYKIWDSDGSLLNHRMKGKFKVKYPDGRISQPFSWRTAKSYKNIFGGEILDNF